MAKQGIKLDQRDIARLFKEINRSIDTAMHFTYLYFKRITPKRSGYARSHTEEYKRGYKYIITGNYPYSQRLDTGWSKQAIKGMTLPSLVYLNKSLAKNFKQI